LSHLYVHVLISYLSQNIDLCCKLTLWSGRSAVHSWQRKPPIVVIIKPLYSVPNWDTLHLDKSILDVLCTGKKWKYNNRVNLWIINREQTMFCPALETVNDRQKNIIKSLQLTFIFNTIFVLYFLFLYFSLFFFSSIFLLFIQCVPF